MLCVIKSVKEKFTYTSALTFFFREVEGPGELLVAAVGGSMTICPVIDESELFVCRPGNFVDVGAILFNLILLLLSDKFECKIFSLFDKQLFWFSTKASSSFNE